MGVATGVGIGFSTGVGEIAMVGKPTAVVNGDGRHHARFQQFQEGAAVRALGASETSTLQRIRSHDFGPLRKGEKGLGTDYKTSGAPPTHTDGSSAAQGEGESQALHSGGLTGPRAELAIHRGE